MSIAEKLATIADNEYRVFNRGRYEGYTEGYNAGGKDAYSIGFGAGKTAEWSAFWDSFQNNGSLTNYENRFRMWPVECYNPKHPIVTSSGSARANSMFNQSTVTDTKVDITINATASTHVFYNTTSLKTIRKLTVNKNVTFSNWFTYASSLEDITFDGEIGQNISFSDCKKLTHDSLMSIINHLYDYKAEGDTSTHTCTIGSTNLAKLTDTEKAIATEKGWTLA